jgi:hypothetical protein
MRAIDKNPEVGIRKPDVFQNPNFVATLEIVQYQVRNRSRQVRELRGST